MRISISTDNSEILHHGIIYRYLEQLLHAATTILTYSGNSPSTRQTYTFSTLRLVMSSIYFLVAASFFVKNSTPDVRRSSLYAAEIMIYMKSKFI